MVTGHNNEEVVTLKYFLDNQFKIKDLGAINFFLGLEFITKPNGMIIHQHNFIKELLYSYFPQDAKPVSSPLPRKLKDLYAKTKLLSDPTSYRQLVGKLNFLLHTPPDLAFTTQFSNQFNSCPTQLHMNDVLQYLKGTISQGIFLNNKQDFKVEAFCDSDWVACRKTRRSVSGFFMTIG